MREKAAKPADKYVRPALGFGLFFYEIILTIKFFSFSRKRLSHKHHSLPRFSQLLLSTSIVVMSFAGIDLCEIPALAAPAGVQSNLVDPVTLAPVIIGVSTSLTVVAILFVTARLSVNYRKMVLADCETFTKHIHQGQRLANTISQTL